VGIFAATSVLFGQLDSNSITVTASRSVYLQPDQVVFSISVSAPTNATLDDIVAALQGSGITAANLSGSSIGPPLTQTLWYFMLPTPLSNIKNTVTSLTMLQQTISQKNNGLSLNFGVQGTVVSAQLQQSQQCVIPDLVSDARTQAQKLVVAAGLTLGPILAIAQGPPTGDSTGLFAFAVPTIAQRTGDFFSTSSFATPIIAVSPTVAALTCSITVKFALLRYQ
jgi:uncharacterized protein YggE